MAPARQHVCLGTVSAAAAPLRSRRWQVLLRCLAVIALVFACVAHAGVAARTRVVEVSDLFDGPKTLATPPPPASQPLRNATAAPTTARARAGSPGASSLSQCTPQARGWDLVGGATLYDVGYHAAAIPVGRHIMLLGGVRDLRGAIDLYNYTLHHTQRGVNVFDPVTRELDSVDEVHPNRSSISCPFIVNTRRRRRSGVKDTEEAAVCALQDEAAVGVEGEEDVGDAQRCIEPELPNGTTPARLLVPVVGTGSVVRVQNRVYAFGACNTLPEGVSLDLVRTSASSDAARVAEQYLRSVLRLRLYQKQYAGADAHIVHQRLVLQPPAMTLRFNATCVAGANGVVYMIGGVDARTGATVTSVAQFDTDTETFVEGVWSLDQPVITPAAIADNGMIFIAGGFTMEKEKSIFFPSRTVARHHTGLTVVDTHRGLLNRDIARYASSSRAGSLQWSSPQLFVRGLSLFMLGTGGKKPYGGVACWMNTSLVPSSVEPCTVFGAVGAPPAAGQQGGEEDGEDEDDVGAPVFCFKEFAFVPARRDAVLAMWPSEDGESVVFYLFGGRTLSTGVPQIDVFAATVTLCTSSTDNDRTARSHVNEAGRRARETRVKGQPQRSKQMAQVVAPVAASLIPSPPRFLGFSYARVMEPHPQQQLQRLAQRWSSLDATATAAFAGLHGEQPSIPNSNGDTCVSANGYTPLWYNISFQVLLSRAETALACPGIEVDGVMRSSSSSTSNHDPGATASSCALMLSSSPQCDEPIVQFRHLSPINAHTVLIPLRDKAGNVIGQQHAYAVARTLLIGSPERGIVHVLATGEDGSRADAHTDAVFKSAADQARPPHQPHSARVAFSSSANEDRTKSNTLLFEQSFVYVCFSRGPSVVAGCAVAATSTQQEEPSRRHGTVEAAATAATAGSVVQMSQLRCAVDASLSAQWTREAACGTPSFETLSPSHALVLSPELTCTNGSGGDVPPTPTPSPAPSPDRLLRPWMLLTILIVLLVVIVAYMLVTFVLMPGYAFNKLRRQRGNAANAVAVAGEPDPDQQRSLLPYREARIFLGQGGVGVGAGGGTAGGVGAVPGGIGAYGFPYDDYPDEYETALTAAGVAGARLSGFDPAGWDDSTAGTQRRRRLLDGKYEVIRKLGKGSFSVVYLVRRISDGSAFALKYLQCSDDVDRHEAMKECEVVYALQGHPNVIQLFDMFMSYRFDRHMVTVPKSHHRRSQHRQQQQRQGRGKASEQPQLQQQRTGKEGSLIPVAFENVSGEGAAAQVSAGGIAGAEANPVVNRSSSKRLVPPREEAAATVEGGVYEGEKDGAALVLSTGADVGVAAATHLGGEGGADNDKHPRRSSLSGADTTITVGEAQSLQLTASSSNTNSAEASTVSRPIVHMDSAYLDAMTAGMLRDDSSESPTTPPATTSAHAQQQQNKGDDDTAAGSPDREHHHERGLSTLQAERYLSLVMAYHERGDLARWVRQRRALQPFIPEATIVSIGFQVLALLSYMHHKQKPPIIHRDLKPENILLSSHVSYENVNEFFLPIVVTDFGLSRVMDKTFCETGVGSLPYVAPECWQRRYSTKVDIWALGCVLYAVCSKRVDSNKVKVMFSECTQPDFHPRLRHEITSIYGYSDALAHFITALLAVNPDDRPTAAEALRMLRHHPTDSNGQPLFYGPPLASLLRASPTTTLRGNESNASFSASTGSNGGGNGGGGGASSLNTKQSSSQYRDAAADRTTSFLSVDTQATSEAPVTPVLVLPATPHRPREDDKPPAASAGGGLQSSVSTKESASPSVAPPQDTLSAGHIVVSSSLSATPVSTRVASTQPPHSAKRGELESGMFALEEDSHDGHNDNDDGSEHEELAMVRAVPILPLSVVPAASTLAPPPTPPSVREKAHNV